MSQPCSYAQHFRKESPFLILCLTRCVHGIMEAPQFNARIQTGYFRNQILNLELETKLELHNYMHFTKPNWT